MKAIKLDELKKIECDILNYVDKICSKYGLQYFVCGGTLLGAIRHDGFIPWDDDIDIQMPRKDYERLKQIVNTEKGYYKFFSMDNPDYYYVFGKLVDTRTKLIETKQKKSIEGLGICIDIFPLDGLPQNIIMAERVFYKYRRNQKYLYNFNSIEFPELYNNIILNIKTIMYWGISKIHFLFLGENKLKFMINKKITKYDYYKSRYVCNVGGRWGEKELYPSNWLLPVKRHKFENFMVNIPNMYHEYLCSMYGNYMELPPIKSRIPDHNFEAYWL
ncbi:LicD family protein [Thomasclavelia cocleata]|uniref:LicD family protein n=1 Tax=Thomasclavelia cocleata TaxID=69824 RepID=UPI00272A7C98|nr:LicD family protein [Thomasclavelia cocleata]